MALYAIGDLHLSLGTDKPMDIFGGGWEDYVEKIKEGFSHLRPDDVCVLCGDTSWGMSLEESLEDFRFVDELPGKKIILKGNHDYWWTTAKKMNEFFTDNGIRSIEILNNNCFFHGDAAICGTRGWILEGEADAAHNEKITARETGRLRASLQAAGAAAEKLCFFHYPPRTKNVVSDEIVAAMNEFGVKRCWYGHLHSFAQRFAVRGEVDGIDYNMVSADYIDFIPRRILAADSSYDI